MQELLAESYRAPTGSTSTRTSLNAQCHYDGIGSEIVEALGTEEPVDVFVAAVRTSATLMGAARRLRDA